MTITISKHPGCISAVGRLEDKIQLTFSNMSWAGPTRLGKRVVCNKSHFSSTWRNTVQGHEAIRRDWMLLSTWRPRISSCIKAHVMRGFSITWANLVPGALWTTCTPSMMISEHDGSPRQVHLFSFFFFLLNGYIMIEEALSHHVSCHFIIQIKLEYISCNRK